AAQQVVAQLPFGVDAVLVAGVLGVRTAQGGRQVAAGADMAAGGVDVGLRAAVDDQRATIRALADVAGIGVADAVRRHAVVGAREGAVAGQGRQGEGVGQVAGVLQDVEVTAALAVVGTDVLAALRGAIGVVAGGEVVGVDVA